MGNKNTPSELMASTKKYANHSPWREGRESSFLHVSIFTNRSPCYR